MALLDLFCGAGGCSEGYTRAGFDVIGIDIEPIRNYVHPEKFYQMDAMAVLRSLVKHHYIALPDGRVITLDDIDAIHTSPPCQGYSVTKRFNPKKDYPKLIEPVRELLYETGKLFVIENVEAAPLYARVILCGAMFPEADLRTYRHRQFETNFYVGQPIHAPHLVRTAKMGRPPNEEEGEFMHVVGNFPSAKYAKKAMGIDWMNREELAESIPPAYTHYVGQYLRHALIEAS